MLDLFWNTPVTNRMEFLGLQSLESTHINSDLILFFKKTKDIKSPDIEESYESGP